MLKSVVYKMFSLLMAFLVLLSTVSFTLEKRYCRDRLIDVAVFSRVEKCGMDMEPMVMASAYKNQCCKDKLEVVKGQENLKKSSSENFLIGQKHHFDTLSYSYIDLYLSLPNQIVPPNDYSPPNLVPDIQVSQQVFII